MQRIKGFDAMMYYSENAHASQHVLGLILLDPATCPKGVFSREAFEALLLSRFDQVDIFRKKFVKAPMGIAFPALVDDPNFRLQNHIRHIALPKPGSRQQLSDIVSNIASVPLDMHRPLWEMTLIDGYEAGKYSVIVSKTHHCLMDGVGGSEMMAKLLDLEPVAPPERSELENKWKPATPSLLELRWSELQDFRSTYSDMATTLGALGRKLAGNTVYRMGSQLGVLPKPETDEEKSAKVSVLQREMPGTVPRLYFNRALTSARSVAFGEFPLEGVNEIRRALNLTFNDVVLGICTLAMRQFLEDHDALPDGNIVASMPISTRGMEGSEGLNQLRIVPTPLPVQIGDPVAILKRTGAILDGIKALHAPKNGGGVKLTKLVTPRLGVMIGWLYGIEGLADYVRFLKSNLAISTVPGPLEQLYLGGAKVVSICPVGPPADGVGLTICVMTYQDAVSYTVTACPDFLPDVQSLADAFSTAYEKALSAVRRKMRARAGSGTRQVRKKKVAKKKVAKTPAAKKSGAAPKKMTTNRVIESRKSRQ